MGKKIAIFVSGSGSNLKAIVKAIEGGHLPGVELALVVSDRPECPAVEWSKENGIAVWTKAVSAKSDFYTELLGVLKDASVEWIVLAGFMRIIPAEFLESWKKMCAKSYVPMVNIHPSLLPAFKGMHAYSQAFEYGVKVTGVSVHLVAPEVDAGPLCAQEAFSIEECQSAEEVTRKGLAVEHRLYWQTLKWVLQEKFILVSKKEKVTCVRQN